MTIAGGLGGGGEGGGKGGGGKGGGGKGGGGLGFCMVMSGLLVLVTGPGDGPKG